MPNPIAVTASRANPVIGYGLNWHLVPNLGAGRRIIPSKRSRPVPAMKPFGCCVAGVGEPVDDFVGPPAPPLDLTNPVYQSPAISSDNPVNSGGGFWESLGDIFTSALKDATPTAVNRLLGNPAVTPPMSTTSQASQNQINWGTIALVGGGLVLGIYLLTKMK